MSKSEEIGAKVLMASGDLALTTSQPLVASPDAELVELCRRGDAQAFERLVALNERMVFSLAARLLGDAEEARDVSQEVFLQVFRTLRGFQGRSSLRTWLTGSAIGEVPPSAGSPPLVEAVRAQARSLGFTVSDGERRNRELDIYRKPRHREASRFCHAMALIDASFSQRTGGPDFRNDVSLDRLRGRK